MPRFSSFIALMLASATSLCSCTFAEDCPTQIRLEGRLAQQDLDAMQVEGSSFWKTGGALFDGLPLSFRFRLNFRDLLRESGTSKESADHIRALWTPDYGIRLKGSGEQGDAHLHVDFFFLGRSKIKVGDPIPVYDGTLIHSIVNDDLEQFVRLRDNAQRWMSSKQPFALVHADTRTRDPGTPKVSGVWEMDRYASAGQVIISEFWPRMWKRVESFEDFDGAGFGRIYRVSANAHLHFLFEPAQPSLVKAKAQCINAREFFTPADETTP